MVTESITDFFFTTSELANENLRRQGVNAERIYSAGNTMIDPLWSNLTRLRRPSFWEEMSFNPRTYLVAIFHRTADVDDPGKLEVILKAIDRKCRGLPVAFPAHPRTPVQPPPPE